MFIEDPTDRSVFPALRDYQDSALLVNLWTDDFQDYPCVTPASDIRELRRLARELNRFCEWQIDPGYIESEIRHEAEHAAMAQSLGFRKVRFALYVRQEGCETHWRMITQHVDPSRDITKLELAAVTAAPGRLSAGDSKALADMGYSGREDVFRRLRKRAG